MKTQKKKKIIGDGEGEGHRQLLYRYPIAKGSCLRKGGGEQTFQGGKCR